jgi:DNA-binding beta-propeller fold protein YncE
MSALAIAAALLSPAIGAEQARGARNAAAASPGNGTFYIATYKGTITVLDEATEKITGEIQLKSGIPGRVVLSSDRSRLYVSDIGYEAFETVDRVKQQSIETFTLSTGNTKTRIWGLQPDPHDKYLILTVRDYTRLDDRWDVGPMRLVQFDLAEKKITRTIPWPNGEERDGAGVIFSPDGKLMYLFGDEILIYETEKFTEVDKWDLSRPMESGAGRVNFGGLDPFSDVPGFYTGLFTMQDPVQNRRLMGIGRVDLANKKVDFRPIGPAAPLGFAVAPDRSRAFGLFRDIGQYEFWTFDLTSYRVTSRTSFAGRPRMSMRMSSNGNYIYIYQAGNTIDLYDPSTFALARTITLDGDMTSLLLLPPPRPAAPGR